MVRFGKKAAVVTAAGVLAAMSATGCSSSLNPDAVVATVGDEDISLGVANFYTRMTQGEYETYYASMMGTTAEDMWKDLDESLTKLKTDYIDIYQFHNPSFCPKPGDESGLYDAAMEAKKQGKIRHIGITNHRIAVAKEAIESGLYETMQFPFSYLAADADLEIVEACREADMGFIAMKGLAGGLIHNSACAYAYMAQPQFAHVAPIWGVQRESELDEFLSYQVCPPQLDGELLAEIEKDKEQLSGDFCRGCGYCMPCPAGIEINNCARMSLMLRRAPQEGWLSEEWQEKMKLIENCLHCGQCMSKCPYGLNTPELLAKNYEDYKTFLK